MKYSKMLRALPYLVTMVSLALVLCVVSLNQNVKTERGIRKIETEYKKSYTEHISYYEQLYRCYINFYITNDDKSIYEFEKLIDTAPDFDVLVSQYDYIVLNEEQEGLVKQANIANDQIEEINKKLKDEFSNDTFVKGSFDGIQYFELVKTVNESIEQLDTKIYYEFEEDLTTARANTFFSFEVLIILEALQTALFFGWIYIYYKVISTKVSRRNN